MPLKVALIIPGFQSDAEDWCIPVFTNLARELSKEVEMHVFALRYPARRDRYDIGNVHVHSLGGGAIAGRRLPAVSLLKLWSDFRSAVEAEHRRAPFAVIMGVWATEAGWLAMRVARRLGLPSLVHLAGGELIYVPQIGYGNYKRGLAGRLVADTLRHADLLTVPSDPMRSALLRAGHVDSGKVIDWAPGVDTDMFAPGPSRTLQAKPFVFVSTGSLIAVKGHDLLVRALALTRAEVPDRDIRLRIVGEGPLAPALDQRIVQLGLKGYVSLDGEVAHDTLPLIYRDSDAFLLGSWHEAQCMAALEAMSCGLPWVGPPVGVLSDIALLGADMPSGVLFHKRDVRDVANAMKKLATLEPGDLSEWGRRSRTLVLGHYSLAEQTSRLLSLLEGLTERNRVAYYVKASL
jgi:glycosyltransferase involved in cell wall biosynthesis